MAVLGDEVLFALESTIELFRILNASQTLVGIYLNLVVISEAIFIWLFARAVTYNGDLPSWTIAKLTHI